MCVCVCVCVCVCKCNVCECYSAVLVIMLTYTSAKTCIKNEWHDYGDYIFPLSISKLREGYALSKCFSLPAAITCWNDLPFDTTEQSSPAMFIRLIMLSNYCISFSHNYFFPVFMLLVHILTDTPQRRTLTI